MRDVIRRELARSSEPDPHKLAARIARMLTDEDRAAMVFNGVVAAVREEIRFARMEEGATIRTGPSRMSVLQDRVWALDGWKLIDDCGVADLEAVAAAYREREAQNAARAAEYEQLAEELRRSGCATVGEMRARQDARTAA